MKTPSVRLLCPIILLGIAAALLTSPDWGESFDARHARELAGNPADIHFRLEITGGPRSFRVGERIPITLLFSSDSAEKYRLEGKSKVSDSRHFDEEFVLERTDVVEPYRDYYGTAVLFEKPGDSREVTILQKRPYGIDLSLNTWFRFDRPGRYRLFLKSHRLTRASGAEVDGPKTVRLAAVSNLLEIEIVEADEAWNRAKLRELRLVLDRPRSMTA